jgi:hypothetical protein
VSKDEHTLEDTMKYRKRLVWIASWTMLAGLALSACDGSSSGGGVMASCTVAQGAGSGGTTKVCQEGTASARQQIEQSCKESAAQLAPDGSSGISVTFVDGPCSREQALGACQISSGGTTLATWYYEDPDGVLSAEGVRTMCAGIHATYLAP